jgi:hypothetical protein
MVLERRRLQGGWKKRKKETERSNDQERESLLFMFEPRKDSTRYVRGVFGSKEKLMILDTGCAHSTMPWDLYVELSQSTPTQLSSACHQGRLADGSSVAIHGIGQVSFRLGNHELEHKFQLAEIDNEILLGMDFFKEHQCVLDFRQEVVKMKGDVIPCCGVDGEPLTNYV